MRLGTGPGHGIDHPDLQHASLFVRAGCATASGRCTQALGEGGARSNPVKFFLSFFLRAAPFIGAILGLLLVFTPEALQGKGGCQ